MISKVEKVPPMAATIAHILISFANFNMVPVGGSFTNTAASAPNNEDPRIIPKAVKNINTDLWAKTFMDPTANFFCLNIFTCRNFINLFPEKYMGFLYNCMAFANWYVLKCNYECP